MEPVCAWKSLDVDFFFFVGFWCFWMLFDPCLGNMLFWVWVDDVSLEDVWDSSELFLNSLRSLRMILSATALLCKSSSKRKRDRLAKPAWFGSSPSCGKTGLALPCVFTGFLSGRMTRRDRLRQWYPPSHCRNQATRSIHTCQCWLLTGYWHNNHHFSTWYGRPTWCLHCHCCLAGWICRRWYNCIWGFRSPDSSWHPDLLRSRDGGSPQWTNLWPIFLCLWRCAASGRVQQSA